ncbi:MAG: hypothetical protein Q9166_006304 [cf. Caloplaca sp. 2 TL-2023]
MTGTKSNYGLQPMPPHHWLFGHISLSANILKALPPYAHGVYIGDQIRQRYPYLEDAFYLDTWPFGSLFLVVSSPDMMFQLTQAAQLPKDKGLRNFLRPLTGKADLVTLEGATWKRWRKIFNPGFSASHILSLVPRMIEEVAVFKDILGGHASRGRMFYLEEATLNLTIDIIGRIVMDHKFESQIRHNDLAMALRSQLKWCTTGTNINPLEYINVLRPVVHLINTRRMNRYLDRELDERYGAMQRTLVKKNKSVIDLALNSYLEDHPSAEGIDSEFRDFAMAQIKLFIFAGHDTTSTGIVFTYHLLAQHPKVLAKLRAEHESVFGTDVGATASSLTSTPLLLNQLPYTLAVIKESLRLYPSVAALRDGQPQFSMVTDKGQSLPTDRCVVWGDHYGTHHNPRYWKDPEKFLPERFLVPEDHELYPVQNAWRPFERGPRNCIGQELALTEIKIILAMTVRDFDFADQYEEFDALRNNPRGRQVNGQRAYMMRRPGTFPADHYPCKVTSFNPGHK